MNEFLIEAEGLCKQFPISRKGTQAVHAVEQIDLQIRRGRTLGVVGESGCGKSTLGRLLAGVLEPTGGVIRYDGCDLAAMDKVQQRQFRQKCQVVWQDPYSSLDPRMRVVDIITEGMLNFGLASKQDCREKALDLMRRCGLFPEQADRYPHEFSGGQRQRVCIARALAPQPDFIICDEAVSALDVSIQAQIINLLKDLQEQIGLTYLFISHDLSIVRFVSDDVIVMYMGRIVEQGPMEAVYHHRAHPYTQALFAANLTFAEKERQQLLPEVREITGGLPASGCRYRGICPYACKTCEEEPPWREVEPEHFVRCNRTF